MLATFAILAMFGSVVSDSLPKLLSPTTGGTNQPNAKLYGKTVYRSGLNEMLEERTRANMFLSELNPYLGRNPFGGTKDRDLIDALILQHEADRLGMPAGPEIGKEVLKNITQGRMTSGLFEALLSRFNNRVSGEQLLVDIANQVRLQKVRGLLGDPIVTPYDVFRAYRDQNERVSAKIVEVPVEKFLAGVAEPTEKEIQTEYDMYKDVLPDPSRETPGFKVPRQIEIEILSIDGNALARGLKDKLTEAELKAAYDSRKSEFQERSELPTDLFAGQPELTPPIIRPFADVRNTLAVSLAEEKAQAEIVDKFSRIKDDVLIPFADQYAAAVDRGGQEAGHAAQGRRARTDGPQGRGQARGPEL
jgi:peptidyl-prolyl cis-trans isomerase D